MNTQTIVKTRVFNLRDISEKEGIILRTLLNLNTEGVKNTLNQDKLYWEDIPEDEAIIIGNNLCEKIMKMVDGD